MTTTMKAAAANLQAKLERQRSDHPDRFRRLSQEEYEAARAAYLQTHTNKVITPPASELRYCGLYQDEIDNLTWENVKPGISSGDSAISFVRAFYGQEYGMVYLGGAPGQAKTLILKIVVAIATRAGKRARYIDLRDVLQNLRASFERDYHRDEFSARMQDWIDIPVLALDEIDKCNETPWAREQIFYLMDKRYQGAVREHTLTILAGNQVGDEMAEYIRSRLKDNRGAFIELPEGPDARRVMSAGNRY